MQKDKPQDYNYLKAEDFNLGLDPCMQLMNKSVVKEGSEVQQVTYIQACWVMMWCLTLSEQQKNEIWFRLKQLLQVLQQLNIDNQVNKTDLYFLMIDTTFKNSEFRITKNLYETMVRFCIPIDGRIKVRQYLHFKKDLKKAKDEAKAKGVSRNAKQLAQEHISDKEYLINRKEQQILITNSKLCKRVGFQYKFKKRTFLTAEIKEKYNVKVEEVRLKLSQQCKNESCNG